MRVDHLNPGAVSGPTLPVTATQRWLVGQLLAIDVIGRGEGNSIRLSIAGQEFAADSAVDLAPGTRLTARVIAAGSPPVLRLVDPPPVRSSESGPVSSTMTTLRVALADALPAQEPLGTVLQRLDARATASSTPSAIQARLLALLQNLPDLAMLARPSELVRAVAHAGQHLESALAALVGDSSTVTPANATLNAVSGDFKLQLLVLRAALDDGAPPLPRTAAPLASPTADDARVTDDPDRTAEHSTLRALTREVDAAIARITTRQLAQLVAAERGVLSTFAEVPFRTMAGADAIALAIETDDPPSYVEDAESTEARSIAVTLTVPIAERSEFRARIGLAGDRLAVALWSDDSALRDRIASGLVELEQRLTAAGFTPGPIAMREVRSPDPLSELPSRLIDTAV